MSGDGRGADRRGREATGPTEIRPPGWKDILKRTFGQILSDRVLAVAAGVTFFTLLAIFPAITVLVSIYGLFADGARVADHLNALSGVLPADAVSLMGEQMRRIASQPPASLGVGFAVGLALALWSANGGMKALFDALNVAYGEKEKRSFIRLNLITLGFTLSAILLLIVLVAAVVVLPVVLAFLPFDRAVDMAIRLARWPVLLLGMGFCLGILYRYGPSRQKARWQWITPGSILAVLVWFVASAGFSWYVANFGSYNETYGSLGAVIGFMTWMWISVAIILIGAELNAESEHQTRRDSTTGPERPMGERGAMMADTLGASANGKAPSPGR